MGKAMYLVCILIFAIDFAAGILGIEAEVAQDKVKHMRYMFLECRQPVPQAYRLGLASAVLLILAHAITNFIGGCTNICSLEESRTLASRQLAAGTLIISWLVFALALSMLVVGAMSNSKPGDNVCGPAHRRFLAVGGSLCFVHALFCVSSAAATAATLDQEERVKRGAGA